jgi:hypothetical protein
VIEVIYAKLEPKFKQEWLIAIRKDAAEDTVNKRGYNVYELNCLERWGEDELGERHIGYSYRVCDWRSQWAEPGEPYKHYLTTMDVCEFYGDVGSYFHRLTGKCEVEAAGAEIADWIEKNC